MLKAKWLIFSVLNIQINVVQNIFILFQKVTQID
jgi:hypothetical protein